MDTVKEYVVNVRETWKWKLYSYISSRSQFLTEDMGDCTGIEWHSVMVMCQGGESGTGNYMYDWMLLHL